ncbi:MAG: penicillin-binding protein 2 [Deltaproteobacteria bacterium]|nr:penicillin-binding protein 2 [Deltaproteobacteria bacterium]
MKLTQEYTHDIEHRFRYFVIGIAIFFLIVLTRLYYLQVMKGEFYRTFSTENSIKEIKIEAPRGNIIDRRGQAIVESRPAFDLILIPQYVQDPPKVFASLSSLISLDRDTLTSLWKKNLRRPRYQPLILKSDISREELAVIRSRKGPWYDERDPLDLRGVEIRMRYQRRYTYGDVATHLLGYVREIDAAKLKDFEKRFPGKYQTGDQVGVRGIEEQWDQTLRGQDGFEHVVVNAHGREVNYEGIERELRHSPPTSGSTFILSIDLEMQRVARDEFGVRRRGAAVVLDVNTGEVLTLFSAPSYDLNRFSGPEAGEYWKELSSDARRPLLHRAIQGTYPPASTYKVVNAISALSENVVQRDQPINCGGSFVFGGRPFRCWAKQGHGPIEISHALASSCDVFFYITGLRLGVDRLAKYASFFGLGHRTGISLADEKSGLIPTAAWKLKRFKVPWQEGETLSIAVGQGYDLVTPLQNALMIAQVANGGKRLRPKLVREPDLEVASDVNSNDVQLDPEVVKYVRESLVGTVADPGGTAHRLAAFGIPIAGKTGTAQVIRQDPGYKCNSELCRDHAWFVGFSPTEKPEVAVAVIVENGGFGATSAAPIAGALLKKYHDIYHPEQAKGN